MISFGVLAGAQFRTNRRHVAGHSLADGRNIRKRLRASRRRHRKRTIPPALMCSIDEGRLSNMTWTCPLIKSVSAGTEPRYGTCTAVKTSSDPQHLSGDMPGTSNSRRRHVELARMGFGEGDKLGDGLHR